MVGRFSLSSLLQVNFHDSQETKKKGNKEGLSCKVEVNTRFPKEKEHGRGNRL